MKYVKVPVHILATLQARESKLNMIEAGVAQSELNSIRDYLEYMNWNYEDKFESFQEDILSDTYPFEVTDELQ